MSIDEIIIKYYTAIRNGKNYKTDESVLFAFCSEYLEIKKLKKEYQKTNNKNLGDEIVKRCDKLNSIKNIFDNELGENNQYQFTESISDYKKVMELLLILSNGKEDKYELKQ